MTYYIVEWKNELFNNNYYRVFETYKTAFDFYENLQFQNKSIEILKIYSFPDDEDSE
jgi:hypothetical protein